MAISSIHFATGKGGYFAHNSREAPTKNAIFSDEENYCSATKEEAFKIYRDELEIRSKAYSDRTGQKLQARATTHLSAIFNFNHDTTVEQAQAVCEYLEKRLDTKVVQMSMHRDEGHHKKHSQTEEEEKLHDLLKIKNYHGHIEFMGLDSQGNSIRRKLDKPTLREIQTDVANILGMERGRHTSYNKDEYFEITQALPDKEEFANKKEYNKAFTEKAKELGLYKEPKARRLDTYDYKKAKEMEAEAVARELAKAKDLQELNKKLREELKEAGATREDYAKLEQLNKQLKEQIKAKDLTIDELNIKIDEYKQGKAPKTNENNLNDKSIEVKEFEQNIAFKSDLDRNLSNHINEKELTIKTGLLTVEKQNLNIVDSPYNLRTSILSTFTKSISDLYEIAKAKAKKFYEDIIKEKDNEIRELKDKVKDLQTTIYGKNKTIENLKEINTPVQTQTKKFFGKDRP